MESEITKLIEKCVQFFTEEHYVKSRIDAYQSLWRHGILRYMKEKKKKVFTSDLGRKFIRDCYPEDDLSWKAREMIRSIRDFSQLPVIETSAMRLSLTIS